MPFFPFRSRLSTFVGLVALTLGSSCGGTEPPPANAPTADATDDTTDDTPLPEDSTAESAPTGRGLPCDVDRVLANSCRSCHGETPAFGAPMPLMRQTDFQAASPTEPTKKIWETTKDRVHRADGTPGRMPQPPNPALSAADLATLDTWFAAGAPASTVTSCGGDSDPIGPGTDATIPPVGCTPNVSVKANAAFTMPRDQRDLYVCYGWDFDVTSKKHVTAIVPRIDNAKIVHHVLLVQVERPQDPTPKPCAGGAAVSGRMLYAWAPGVAGFELPPAAGLPVEPSGTGKAHYLVQVHYNNIKALSGEVDRSGFDLCSTDTLRPNDADIVAFGTMNFTIPPRARYDITASYTMPSSSPQIRVIGAFPHMHQLGKAMSTTVQSGGSTVDLGTASPFSFDDQFFAPLPEIVVRPGDVVRTRCVWENPGATAVPFGEDTEQEMCYSFTMYYPKIAGLNWVMPALRSTVTENR
jgi:hypothetical protein